MIVSLVDSVLHLPPIWLTKGVRTKHAFCVCIVYSRKLETRDLQYSWQCINFSQEVKGYVTIHQHNLSERRSCLTFASLSRSKSYSLTSCSIFYPKQALQRTTRRPSLQPIKYSVDPGFHSLKCTGDKFNFHSAATARYSN